MSCNISDIVADETLFQEIQRGDEKAFDVLFLKYYPSLCAYAQRFVEYDDGQEIVQDVMVWLWENREMHTFEISPKSYLFKAVKNRCLTLISRNEIKQKIINTLYDNQQLEYEDPDFYIVEFHVLSFLFSNDLSSVSLPFPEMGMASPRYFDCGFRSSQSSTAFTRASDSRSAFVFAVP